MSRGHKNFLYQYEYKEYFKIKGIVIQIQPSNHKHQLANYCTGTTTIKGKIQP